MIKRFSQKSHKSRNITLHFLSFVLGLSYFQISCHAQSKWQTLSTGIQYKLLSPETLGTFAQIHVFKLSLNHTKLSYCQTQGKTTTVKESARLNHAPLVFNGAFFSPEFSPLGLRIQDNKILSPLKKISWWGVFYIKHNKAFITKPNTRLPLKKITFAIQAGPRLIVNNQIPNLKPGKAERTAIGINKNKELILVVTQNTAISTKQLAYIMRDSLGCTYALNLDGGGSTQLFAKFPDFKKQVYGFSKIPDPVCVHHLN